MSKKKTLVAYFSCTGTTKKAASLLAETLGADLYEIKPERPYTEMDLNWVDKRSRSSLEMNDPHSRPAISGKVSVINQYDTVFIGFPIWWYVAPTIINTFLESYDFAGKRIIPFATSGGSSLGQTEEKLRPSCSLASTWLPGKILNGNVNKAMLTAWINTLNL